MKKTVNINLGGTLFHIDEDAFGKLTRYLDAIRASLKEPEGSDEIIRDIEARIAELFTEKIENSAQVISLKELDEVIAVMGQPEDYSVDEELFEDASFEEKTYSKSRASSSHKQLYKDIDNKVISGVSSGLGHYIGIDPIWVRLLWVILVIAGWGTPILIYILLWIIVPPAVTTSEKLKMTGEPINISNIEKKFKEGYENVADRVKNVDYDKYGHKIKSGASGFFDTLASLVVAIFKIFVKFIGVIIIITALSALIGLVVGMFTVGSIDMWGTGELMDYVTMANITNTPIWLVSILILFAIGIPFFVLFILGLKLLVTNLRSIGRPAKILLLLLWIASIIGLGILGVRLATEKAYDGESVAENLIPIKTGDTLKIAMISTDHIEEGIHRNNNIRIRYDDNEKPWLYSSEIRLTVRSTNDSVGKIIIEKRAEGNSFIQAKKNAEAIIYDYVLNDKQLNLNSYFTTDPNNKYRDQEVEVYVYLPVGTVVFSDENIDTFHGNHFEKENILENGQEGHYVRILNGKSECLDCPEEDFNNENDDGSHMKIDININDKENGNKGSWEEEVNNSLQERNNNSGTKDKNHISIDENGVDIQIHDKEDTLNIKLGGNKN